MRPDRDPKTLRELVLADLARAQRLIMRVEDELDPQFRISTPEGDYWIAMTLDADLVVRARQMHLVSRFMAWKKSPGFTMAAELQEPDAVCAVGVTHNECVSALSMIQRLHIAGRRPVSFGPVQWLTRAQIGDEYPKLLPKGIEQLTKAEIAELEVWFGPAGKFPAVKLDPSGKIPR